MTPNLDYYIDQGRLVLTRYLLLKRPCCYAGCRHCPHGNGPGLPDPQEVRQNYPPEYEDPLVGK